MYLADRTRQLTTAGKISRKNYLRNYRNIACKLGIIAKLHKNSKLMTKDCTYNTVVYSFFFHVLHVCLGGLPRGVSAQGGVHLPSCGQNDRGLWKHYLSATTVADGKNAVVILQYDKIKQKQKHDFVEKNSFGKKAHFSLSNIHTSLYFYFKKPLYQTISATLTTMKYF